jgi:hypothetical protein
MVLVSEKAASSPKEMSKILSGRLEALQEANALVQRNFADKAVVEHASLAELIEKIMRPHTPPDGEEQFRRERSAYPTGRARDKRACACPSRTRD